MPAWQICSIESIETCIYIQRDKMIDKFQFLLRSVRQIE